MSGNAATYTVLRVIRIIIERLYGMMGVTLLLVIVTGHVLTTLVAIALVVATAGTALLLLGL